MWCNVQPAMTLRALSTEAAADLAHEVDAICISSAFRHSPQQQRMLRHLVTHASSGNLASLREIALAIDVFRRPAVAFDPKKDSIVRVEARRLRERLARYYEREGELAAIEIVIPVGSYSPLVRARTPRRAAGAGVSPRARRLMERGWYMMRQRTIDGYRTALELFTRAVHDHPGVADAQHGVAWARICIAGFEGVPAEAGNQREAIHAAIEHARALEPDHVYLALLDGAYAFRFEHAVAASVAHHRVALGRAPADPILLGSCGWLHALIARFDEAQAFFDAAHEREPFGFWHRHNLASLAYLRHDYATAEMLVREALEIAPDHLVMRLLLARVLMCDGRAAEAVAQTAWCGTVSAQMSGVAMLHVAALARSGDATGARAALEAFERDGPDVYVSPVFRAIALAALDDEAGALVALERAVAERDYWLPNLRVEPLLDGLRGHPAFAAILAAGGLDGGVPGPAR